MTAPPAADACTPPERLPVLVAEDDAALRLLLAHGLRQHGWPVTEAADAPAALAALAHTPPYPLLLLDLGLPPAPHTPQQGLAVLSEALARCLWAKVVVLTGQSEEASAYAAIQAGAFDFLAKPAPLEQVVQALQRAELFARQERRLRSEQRARLSLTVPLGEGLKTVRAEAEERLIRAVLEETHFNVAQTAKRLGIKRENVYYFLKKHGLTRDGPA
jgi:DNA-binding NtrC family response regulator